MAPPYDLKAHWTFDFDIYKDYTGSPVMLKNLGRKNTALDLSGSKKPAGSPVLAYPINNQTNQAWLLEYLETVTPAPPPPGPCEFPERDQKAMRGSIVEECVTFTWFTSAFPNAEECYNWMNSFPKEYGILSYVFFAATIPGSPDSGSTWSECRGYYGRSYLYFVGNATGPGFGGDLALPFK
ncbi:MAG: hypothetical protein L6R36_008976 [Xanthoria steineri]|nr:MAG: hypothetical protein L6R36_008976 [Xanthoria steineri]